MKWVAFFSKTGSEIMNISDRLLTSPDIIVTNNENIKELEIYKRYKSKIYILPRIPSEKDYLKIIEKHKLIKKNTLMTLHGFLRIIPKEICLSFNIINGHPGLITLYPKLKGLNPQKKSYKLNHPYIGVVLHKVIEEVDSGEVIKESRSKATQDFEENLKILTDLSLGVWSDFLMIKLNGNNIKYFINDTSLYKE